MSCLTVSKPFSPICLNIEANAVQYSFLWISGRPCRSGAERSVLAMITRGALMKLATHEEIERFGALGSSGNTLRRTSSSELVGTEAPELDRSFCNAVLAWILSV